MSPPRPIVLLTDPIHPEPTAAIAARAQVRVAPATDAASLRTAASDADIIVVRSPLPDDIFDHAPRMRGAIRHGAGVDMIPVEQASRAGIAVANAPGTNAVTVAEYALGQMLSLSHQLRRVDATLRAQGWASARRLNEHVVELAGKTLGVVGVGAIGAELARMCHMGLRMDVIGYRPSTRPIPEFVRPVSLDELFSHADVIVLACPLNERTRGMIDARLLGRMKPDSFLINVSRGAVVDEAALIRALEEAQIAGAALDVFAVQPLPADSPLLRMPNVILSAHQAGVSAQSLRRMGDCVARQVLELLDGRLPSHFVNHEAHAAVQARLSLLGQA